MMQPQGEAIRTMFSQIAGRYDLTNTVLSFGIHHLWRKSLVRWSEAESGNRVLDCASGTGDLAFEFEKTVGRYGQVMATDFCEDMLQFGIQKALKRDSRVRFQVADVLNLPFPDANFDVSSIAFGIRNVSDPARGLAEMGRVTKPGGRVMVLEFGQSPMPVWGQAFDFYSKTILPGVGGYLTGKRDAYEYLSSSSAGFPCREKFLDIARSTGLYDEVKFKPLMGGIAYIYRLRRRRLAS